MVDTTLVTVRGSLIRSEFRGQRLNFFVHNELDTIQKHHMKGVFYEKEELSIIERFFPKGGVFLDIGSNVGNHAIFVGKFLHPSQVILIEPNPDAVFILRANIHLNELGRSCDLSMLGVGLSDADGWATVAAKEGNLGAARLVAADAETGVRIARGDTLLDGRRVDFIKIDVEGMEMRALNGLKGSIAANRPTMFVEVEKGNRQAFLNFVAGMGYVVKETFKRYEINENFLVTPVEGLR